MSEATTAPLRVEFAGTARRDLLDVPPKIILAILEFAYGDLARNPRRVGRPLRRELEGLWGARRGPYRIIYEIHDERGVVILIHIDHRANVYHTR
ncbi:MAG: type II toxin-antitoxin system RelE/ParE family toxin [Bifidobacteriaceae bacterium]|nr:type II toxin-antitoxin system RelE/ParE family toxin [Bifidobacteriaceae bacterium]